MKGEGKHHKPSRIMSNRPRRECKSQYRRDSSPQKENKRKSVGREDLLSKKRNITNILKPPANSVLSPISVTPNPRSSESINPSCDVSMDGLHMMKDSLSRISISPCVMPEVIPPAFRTDWDISQVVGRDAVEPEESHSIIKSYAELLQDSVEDVDDGFSKIDDVSNTNVPPATQSNAILAVPCGNELRVDCFNKETCT